jgi:subtilisin family serine protease
MGVNGRAWPEGCREIVATLREGTPEAERVVTAPHWRRAEGHTPAELSRRLAALVRGAGDRGTVGRAFTARCREHKHDPFSDATETTASERATGMSRVIRLRVDDPGVARIVARRLRESEIAESAHPVFAQAIRDIAPEPSELELPSMEPGGWALRVIRADEAMELEGGSPDVVVGVLDSGIEESHREFRGRLVPGYDFVDMPDAPDLVGDITGRDPETADEAGHGTHVAGVIGARGDRMPKGVGGKCRLMALRALGTAVEGDNRVGVGTIPDIDDAIKFGADEGIDVMNASVGVNGFGGGMPHRRAIEYARRLNVVVVAASGNDGSGEPLYPAAVPGVITVGAVSEVSRVTGFSSWGPHLDVVAPGTAIYSADLGNQYRYRDGTSHAAPFVSGVAALIIARARRQNLRLRESAVRRIIRDTADSLGADRSNDRWGAGVLNALDAVVLVSHLIAKHLRRDDSRQTRVPLVHHDNARSSSWLTIQ